MITLNFQEIKPTIFPDGTSQVWKLSNELLNQKLYLIKWSFASESELFHLFQILTLIKYKNECKIFLDIDYLPYGRQDKEVSNDTTFALNSFAQIINAMGFDRVDIFDPHSDVALNLIKNSNAIYPRENVKKAFEQSGAEVVIYPDKGAREKYSKMFNYPFIVGDKVRDQHSGKILEYSVEETSCKSVLIVDDICDGGMTFIELSRSLKKKGVEKISLYVSHGLFTKGLQILKEAGINEIYTKDGKNDTF